MDHRKEFENMCDLKGQTLKVMASGEKKKGQKGRERQHLGIE